MQADSQSPTQGHESSAGRVDVGLGFPRTARLLDKAQFQQVFGDARKSIDPYFTVLARRNPHSGARLGLAIAKKCARRAVDRNRLKRLVRESFRIERADLPDVDLVVMCRRDAIAADNPRLAASLARHWARIRKQLCAESSSA
jgi:ribonuclease P protein component